MSRAGPSRGSSANLVAKEAAVASPAAAVPAPEAEEEPVAYHCDYCRKDISKRVRIKCSKCVDFDLVGVEVTPHKNDHPYQVMTRVNFPIFDETWEAEEELLMLEGIEKYGLGNWTDISDHIGTKTKQETSDHYFSTYIDVETFPLPRRDHILTSAETLEARKRESDRRNTTGMRKKRKTEVKHAAHAQSSSKTLPGQKPPNATSAVASQVKRGEKPDYASCPVNNDLAGFMPRRGEFENEFNNDAETVIAGLTFNDDDTPEEEALKYEVLDIYNEKLKERREKRDFVISRELMNVKVLQSKERKMERDDRELYNKLRMFMQVLSKDDYETFVNGLIAERKLRRRIDKLRTWRSAGIRTVAEGELFQSKRSRDQQFLKKHSKDMAYADKYARSRTAGDRHADDEYSKFFHKVPKPKKSLAPLAVGLLPNAELLSDSERQLCSNLRLYPDQYVLVKDAILREDAKVPSLTLQHIQHLFKIAPEKTAKIFEYLRQSGWIGGGQQLPLLSS